MPSPPRSITFTVVLSVVLMACSNDADTTTTTPTTAPPTTAASTTRAAPATTAAPPTTVSSTSTAVTSTTATTPPPDEDVLEIVTAEQRNEELTDPPISIRAATPQARGLSDEAIRRAINDRLTAIVGDGVERFISDVGDYIAAVETAPEEPPSSIDLSYEVRIASADVLSIRFDTSTYFQGAARPSHAVTTISFDLATGKELMLADLFTGTEWAFALDTLVRRAVVEQVYGGDEAGLDGWVDPADLLIPPHFALSPSGFEFSFEELEIGPGVLGAPTVTMPYTEIGVYVDPAGPVGRLLESG